MRGLRRAVLACALALGAGCGGEYEEVEVDTGFRGAAARNPLLAAERTLTELGRRVESTGSPEVPDDTVAVLLLGAEWLTRQGEREARVERWALDGGHLVVAVHGVDAPRDADWAQLGPHPLLAELDVELDPSAGEPLAARHDDWETPVRRAEGALALDGLEVDFADGPALRLGRDGAHELIGRMGRGDVVDAATFVYGAGRVTVLSSASFAWNGALEDGDAAALLWRLVEPARPGAVRFVLGRERTLVSLLVERAPLFVLAAVLLVLAGLWRATERFGPPVVEPPRERRAFEDHLVASGRFLWRRGGVQVLLEPLRRRVLRAAERRGSARRDREHLVALLSDRTGLARDRVEAVLFGEVHRDPAAFLAAARHAHLLERAHDRRQPH